MALAGPSTVVRGEMDRLLGQFAMLFESPAVFDEWLALVTVHRIIGKQVHDARLVAISKAHQVAHVLTFNTADFKVFGEVAVSPEKILAE